MRAARAWGLVVVLALTWPFFLPGEAFALRDMMVLPDMALTRAALGFGDLPARNVPQDALLGLVPFPVLAVRLLVVSAAACAAWAGWRASESAFGRAAAMTVAVWNPFVVERLLQGQWSLVIAAWLLPWIAVSGSWAARWAASLTPTGAIASLLFSRSWAQVIVAALLCLPWVVAGALAGGGTASEASAAAFGPRAEVSVGTLGALLGLGGIWNADAVPPSRAAGFALFGVVLFALLALGWRAVPRRLHALAALGFALAILSWSGALAWAVQGLPGGGLLRDGHKWVMLAIPAMVSAAGALSSRVAGAALACALLQVPDAPLAVSALRPVSVQVPAVDDAGRDVFFVDRPSLARRTDGVVVVDPAPKVMNVVESGQLRVDATVVDPPSPRWEAASRAVHDRDVEALRGVGVGVVVYPDLTVWETGAPARGLPVVGVSLLALWLFTPIFASLSNCYRRSKLRV
ncbi:hypothetical protein CAPI_08695 [Corynebacterium capitovis DSM 44611]|uniref:hypothetical protein n=1 Tax=Corynebacterium capitovis TaxID=131081 RepID=UPI00036A6CD4|nr:hypothetical protein [Corynebacterium capitovis]WKD58265.1 hypothetical protein CAPI_08695 [Corynebacterium capitovis DSM 44611]